MANMPLFRDALLLAVALICVPALQAQAPPPVQTSASPPIGFAQAFDAALANDAPLRAARFERESVKEGVPIARAALLPSAALNVNESLTQGRREFPNSQNQLVAVRVDYLSPQATLQMRAPIFNWESISRYRQSLVQSEAADAVFRVRAADLMERLTLAYLQRLLADENVALALSQVSALEGQQLRADQRLQRGEGTRIEVSETTAQLSVARIRLLEAQDQVTIARRGLARITGLDVGAVRNLPVNFRPSALPPQGLDEWLALAAVRNPTVQVRTQQAEVARLAIQRSKAGHYPRLDAVASLSKSSNESLANLNQSSKLASVGLQLSIPLFSGFGIEASVRQSQSDLARAEAELTNDRENTALEVQKQFIVFSNGLAKIEAQERAVVAMEVALDGITRGVPAGLRTLSEVLDAQSKVFSVKRDLAQARFDYFLARMRLQAQSGAPLAEIVFDLDNLLATTP